MCVCVLWVIFLIFLCSRSPRRLYIGNLRHPGLSKTTAQPTAAATTAAKTDLVTDRRPSNPVAANGVPERHRSSAAVHTHGGRVRACAQKSRHLFWSLRQFARIRIGRRRARRL